MPKVSFLTITNYLEGLAAKHITIKSAYRWNVGEVSGALRKGIDLPVMLIDPVETQTNGDASKTFHSNTTAFTILGKPNTKTGNFDEYEAQNQVLELCQTLCFDMEARILHDAQQTHTPEGKNWMYGLVEANSFHFFKVGPLFSDGLYGYRCEVTFKNQVPTCVDASVWSDL